MKTVTKTEWDNTLNNDKKIYEGIPYMVYKENDATYFGPVRIVEGDDQINFSGRPVFTTSHFIDEN